MTFETPSDRYRLPPQSVVDIINAAPEPGVFLSPDGHQMLLVESDALPDVADLARPMHRLAGMRIDPQANARFRSSFRKGLLYCPIDVDATQQAEPVRISVNHAAGESPKIGLIKWSHNSRDFVFTTLTEDGTSLYATDIETLQPRLIHPRFSGVLNDISWLPNGKELIFSVVPENHNPPAVPSAPIGPAIQTTDGETSPTRTYQDLLKTPYDKALFAYHATTEVVIANVSGEILKRWDSGMYVDISPAPDGIHLLVTRLKRPFSYLLTWQQFPLTIDVFSLAGEAICQIADIPAAENIPIEGVRTEPRMIHWMSSRPASLCYTTALDGGDPSAEADFRDQVWIADAPFASADGPDFRQLMKIQHRHWGMTYFATPEMMLVSEYDRDKRWIKRRFFDFDESLTESTIIEDRSVHDKYNSPGHIIQRCDAAGHYIVDRRGDIVFRAGAGATESGNRPFLDQQNLKTLKTDQIWRCDTESLESVVKVLPEQDAFSNGPIWLSSHQSPSSPPNLWLRKSGSGAATEPVAITDFRDPTPQIRDIKKEIVTYQRSDGVQLSATLYLPADHQPGQRLPLLVWAYPQEFNDPSTAGQVSGSSQTFTRMAGITHLTLVTQGYAVMDAATMPVIGDPETMNDTFISQIVDAAKAAVAAAVDRGVADPDRVAVGGHSYGAFMTANLLANCDIFAAGIARSGAYNRTLTPFGFQSERRTLWEAKEIYNRISPFMSADQIKTPLLLTHGAKDNNPGTFPLQSERLYQAIKGNGGTARLVVLPHESHSYYGRQSVLHTQAEMIEWLDRYVKQAGSDTPPA